MSLTRMAALGAIAAAIAITAHFGPLAALVIVLVPALGLVAALGLFGPKSNRASVMPLEAWTARESGWEPLASELSRSRRYGRSLTLVRVHLPADLRRGGLMAQLGTCVRATDRAWVDGDDLFVVMPESTYADAARLTERMRASVGAAFAGLSVRVAAFPDDALSGAALMELVIGPEPTAVRSKSFLIQG